MDDKEKQFWVTLSLGGGAALAVLGTGLFAVIEEKYRWAGILGALGIVGMVMVWRITKHGEVARMLRYATASGIVLFTWFFLGYDIYDRHNRPAPADLTINATEVGHASEQLTIKIIDPSRRAYFFGAAGGAMFVGVVWGLTTAVHKRRHRVAAKILSLQQTAATGALSTDDTVARLPITMSILHASVSLQSCGLKNRNVVSDLMVQFHNGAPQPLTVYKLAASIIDGTTELEPVADPLFSATELANLTRVYVRDQTDHHKPVEDLMLGIQVPAGTPSHVYTWRLSALLPMAAYPTDAKLRIKMTAMNQPDAWRDLPFPWHLLRGAHNDDSRSEVLMAKPAQKIRFFYCYDCGQYEPKTSSHYRNQRRRFSRRKKAREEVHEGDSANGNRN